MTDRSESPETGEEGARSAAASRPDRPPFPLGVVLFTAAYMVAAGIGAVVRGNTEFLFYIAVMLVLIGLAAVVDRRVHLSRFALWGLSLWGLAHMVGGLVPVPASWPIDGDIRVFYSTWIIPGRLKYDHVVHAAGFGVTMVVCWEAMCAGIERITGRPRETIPPRFGLLVLCAAAGMGFGALNEVIEFVATLLVPKTNVGGYENTGWDLVSNLVGALIATVGLRLWKGRG